MSLNTLFIWLFTLFGMINFVHLGLYIIGANIYDVRTMLRQKKRATIQQPFEPLVTVLIPAHNEETGIIRTIETVSQSTYKNIAIVVVDDASVDKTSKLVREYIASRSKRIESRFTSRDGRTTREYFRPKEGLPPICLLTRPFNSGKAAGLNYALRHAVQGGLTMTLDADSYLNPDAIEKAVQYFRDEKIVGVAANVKIMEQHTVLGMLQKFEHMIGYRSKKFYTITNSEFIIGGVASTYRYDTLKAVGFYDTDTSTEDIGLSMKIIAQGNRDQRIVYAADVVASTQGVQSFGALLRQRYRWKLGSLQNLLKYRQLSYNNDRKYSRSLTYYRIPMAFISEGMLMLQPLLVAYLLGISIAHHNIGVWISGYMTITLYVFWTIWPDEHHTSMQKLLLSLYAPGMYFCFFIMDAVQVSAIFKCLFNFRQVIDLSSHRHSTWVSPERIGNPA
jgi:biofilm PGA synthesis N-glycosyltransferase PgaC